MKIFRRILFVLVLAALVSAPCFGQNRPAFKKVYTPQRIAAFKNVIRYYNPSISEGYANRIARAIIYYSHKHGIEDDRFVASVITIESMFNPYAVSRSGAQGLGQLMPGTARMLRVNNSFDIEQNVDGCCRYLKKQLNRYARYSRQQRYELTLAAYNAGPGAVRRWGGIPPYRQTQRYVVDVINVWRQLCGLKPTGGRATAKLKSRARIHRKRVKMKITRSYVHTRVHNQSVNN